MVCSTILKASFWVFLGAVDKGSEVVQRRLVHFYVHRHIKYATARHSDIMTCPYLELVTDGHHKFES